MLHFLKQINLMMTMTGTSPSVTNLATSSRELYTHIVVATVVGTNSYGDQWISATASANLYSMLQRVGIDHDALYLATCTSISIFIQGVTVSNVR